jgi:type II secretory pathway pseudopilin PulG
MIETLVATAIITVAMLGSVGVFMGTATLTARTTEAATAATLARRGIEEAKNLGFANLVEGSTVRYYDVNGGGGAFTTATTDRFKVTTTVTSSSITNGVVDQMALRTAIVTVRRKSDNTLLETTGTYFSWGGP